MMNPSKGGWIRKYFSILGDYKEKLNAYPDALLTSDELFYSYLQPTGIMYGFPTALLLLEDKEMEDWSTEEKFKVLLLEGLILVDHLRKGAFDRNDLEGSLAEFVRFYEDTQLETAKKSWLNFKGSDVYEKLESIIGQRIDIKNRNSRKFWMSYLSNNLIFQDLLLYHDYHNEKDVSNLSQKRGQVALDLVKVVSAASHSDVQLRGEETTIFDIYLASADLDKESREEAKLFWDNKQGIDQIHFDYKRSWVLNRYILEIAVLTVWSDRTVTQSERDFLNALTDKLGLSDEEKDKSFIAIQAFVMNNHETVPFLNGKGETELLMAGATERWRNVLGRNKDKLAMELRESKDLLALIAKSTTEELSKEEKEKARLQLKDLARTIPSLTLFMLPGGSLLLPIILKIIPDLVPTAFRSNHIDEQEKTKKPE